MNKTRSFIATLGFSISLFLCGTVIAEGNQQEDVLSTKKEIVTQANSKWKRDYEIYRAKAKEAEKRGEFASVSPPKSLKPFKDWDYYYLDGSNMGWFPNKHQEYKKLKFPVFLRQPAP